MKVDKSADVRAVSATQSGGFTGARQSAICSAADVREFRWSAPLCRTFNSEAAYSARKPSNSCLI